jgi:hypothetical protein
MHDHFASRFRVLLLLALALFVAQFAGAAQGTSQQPAQRQVPPQRQVPAVHTEPQAEESGEPTPQTAEQAERQQQLQQQMVDLRQQIEQEALNKMRDRRSEYGVFDRTMDDIVPFFVFVGVTLALLWILRTVLENRRWYRMVKVQTETHAKLLDRFGSSQEMLAYMQSEAGRKFLEAPVFEGQRRQVLALPFGRILWSVQIGIVATFVGAGILFLRGRVSPDADMGFEVFGTLILTLGLGFLASGGVSYVLAKYFGLLERPEAVTRPEHNV